MKYKYYTDGNKNIRVYDNEPIPDGFWRGKTFNTNPWNKGLTAETDNRVKNNVDKAHKTRNQTYHPAWNKGLTKEMDERVLNNWQKTKTTIQNKYGVDNIIYHQTKQKNYKPWNKGKTKETDVNMKKASDNHKGVTAWNKGLTLEDDRVKKYHRNWENGTAQLKRIKTQKQNNTLGKNKFTKPELKLYDELLQCFEKEDIEYQYASEKYPFKADFYIKSYDIYIELHANPRHNNHPFDKNNESDIIESNILKQKALNGDSWSKEVIIQWLDLDIRKMEIANKNNLNFIAIYPNKNGEDIVYTHWKQCGEEIPSMN